MSKSGIAFHATKDELINIIDKCIYKYNLYIVCIKIFPEFECEMVRKEEFKEKFNSTKNIKFISLYNYEPNVSVKEYNDFLDTNKDGLLCYVGEQKIDSLKESYISTITDDVYTLKIWKSIIRSIKRSMIKGAWVANPYNSARKYHKDINYTVGAKKLFEEGVKILPVAGWNFYILEKID